MSRLESKGHIDGDANSPARVGLAVKGMTADKSPRETYYVQKILLLR